MRRVTAAALCVASALIFSPGPATADSSGGNPRWTASYAYGAPSYTQDVVVSPDDSAVFVTGVTAVGPSARISTLAYSAADGSARWVDSYPGEGSGYWGYGWVLTTTPDGSTLFASGYITCTSGCDGEPFEGAVTIAYDAATGDRRWVARLPSQGGAPNSIAVSPDGSAVFLSGGDGFDGTYTVAYDAVSGNKIWRVNGRKEVATYTGGTAVTPDGDLVVVTATALSTDTCYGPGGYRISAYHASDGSEAWTATHRLPPGGHSCGTPTDLALSPDGSSVFVTGYGGGDHDGYYGSGTVALATSTGAELWSTIDDSILTLGGDTIVPLDVSPDGSKVFVSGAGCAEHPTCTFATSAYDASTGQADWRASYDAGGRAYPNDVAVSPDGASLYVTGGVALPCFVGCSTTESVAPLVAYDTTDGRERWVSTFPDNGGSALAVSGDGASIYLAGTYTSAQSTSGSSARGSTCAGQCGYSTTRLNARPGPGTFQESDAALQYDGWRNVFDGTAIGGAYRSSSHAGDTASFTTPKVEAFSWLTHEGPSQGKAKLVVDGRVRRTVDLYSATPGRRTVTIRGLDRSTHRVKVKVLGRSNPASGGAAVAVDAFRYRAAYGIAEESSPQLRFNSWAGRTNRMARAGALRWSGSPGAKVSLDFKGRRVVWLTLTGPASGRARVAIDGETTIVDLYRAARNSRAAVSFTGLGSGSHHIVVTATGRKDRQSSSPAVAVDGFLVRR